MLYLRWREFGSICFLSPQASPAAWPEPPATVRNLPVRLNLRIDLDQLYLRCETAPRLLYPTPAFLIAVQVRFVRVACSAVLREEECLAVAVQAGLRYLGFLMGLQEHHLSLVARLGVG